MSWKTTLQTLIALFQDLKGLLLGDNLLREIEKWWRLFVELFMQQLDGLLHMIELLRDPS